MKEKFKELILAASDLTIKADEHAVTFSRSDAQALIDLAVKEAVEKSMKETQKLVDKQSLSDRTSLVSIFGIFASVLSFLTVEFQFLKRLHNVTQIIGFSFILCALLLQFNIALDYLVRSRIDTATPFAHRGLVVVMTTLLIAGLFLLVCQTTSLD